MSLPKGEMEKPGEKREYANRGVYKGEVPHIP